jgi:hypothetical protein
MPLADGARADHLLDGRIRLPAGRQLGVPCSGPPGMFREDAASAVIGCLSTGYRTS